MLIPVVPRMRGIKEAIALLKEEDPGTCLTEYRLRQLVNSGEIPCCVMGGKKLINYDLLCKYLSGQAYIELERKPVRETGKIRRVAER